MSIIDARASTSSSSCSSSVTPSADENVSVSRRISSMSWNRVIAQKPLLGVRLGLPVDGVALAELAKRPERDLLDEGVVARQVDLVQPNAHRGLLGCDAR